MAFKIIKIFLFFWKKLSLSLFLVVKVSNDLTFRVSLRFVFLKLLFLKIIKTFSKIYSNNRLKEIFFNL